ncbi:MAG: universal stress protein [Meiothermus sp.]|nr:universal stress protein [Meiothermus sp.]
MNDPSPDELLKAILKSSRGRHKIFVGAAAGVGKTFRALQEIREALEAGQDALIGYLETHGRAETVRAAEGLPVFPRREVEHGGVRLPEMDLDGLLERRPALALVDELAHTNAPGSRNPRRWQDVEELLSAGISVVSTMNVQHLESVNDLVARLTGVRVKERVPDKVLNGADEVVLVDLTPEALRERLRAGKIYPKEKIEQSLQNFFTAENLAALRELALRSVADKVEDDASEAEASRALKERICVAVTEKPRDALLIRRGARMSHRLKGDLYVVYVRHKRLSRQEERSLDQNRVLAESLQGRFEILEGRDVAGLLARFVKAHDITQLVMGENRKPSWMDFFRGSTLRRVLALTSDIDVHIIDRPLPGD